MNVLRYVITLILTMMILKMKITVTILQQPGLMSMHELMTLECENMYSQPDLMMNTQFNMD